MAGILKGITMFSVHNSTMRLPTTPPPWDANALHSDDDSNCTVRINLDFRPAGPLMVMLACLFVLFLAVGIPTFIQKKRREARERQQLQRPHENYGSTTLPGDAPQTVEESSFAGDGTSDSKG